MSIVVSAVVLSVFVLWAVVNTVVSRRLSRLKESLPKAYQTAAFAPPGDTKAAHLIPLSIDLMRKQRCTPALDTLSAAERRVALYAYAIETQPAWLIRLLNFQLRNSEKALVNQLRYIKSSQPNHPEVHFGAIKAQQRLRSSVKT